MSPELWTTIIVAAFTSGTIISILKILNQILMKCLLPPRVDLSQELAVMSKAYAIMEEMVKLGYCDRVTMFAGHNSGGIPRFGSPFYVTALHSVHSDRIAPQDYENLSVDSHYVQTLVDVIRNQDTHIKYRGMDRCQLKDYYELEGVSEAFISYLGLKANSLYYLSMTIANDREYSDKDLTYLRLRVKKIQYLLSSSYHMRGVIYDVVSK